MEAAFELLLVVAPLVLLIVAVWCAAHLEETNEVDDPEVVERIEEYLLEGRP